jgi:tetratricopeptide (TPR) repeat protein
LHPHPLPNPLTADARRLRVLAMAAVALLAACVYALALRNGYAIDDETIVWRNPVVHGFGNLRELVLGPYWQKSGDLYRPVTLVSFALDWTLFGASPGPAHGVNVLLHAAVAVLVAELVRRLGGGIGPAAAAGAVFAVHPVHVEAVANLVGRSELLAALFVLLACHVYLRGSPRSAGRIAAVAALYLLGLGSKEIAVTLPALLLAVDALRLREERAGVRALLVRNAPLLAVLVGTLGVYLLLRVQANGGLLGQGPAPYLVGMSTSTRVATAVSLWPEYVRLLVWPATLSADWGPDLLDVAGWGSPRTWLGAAIILASAAAAWHSWRRGRWTAAAVLWFTAAVLPVSHLPFAAGTMLAERNLYLPSVALAFLLPPLAAAVARERTAVRWAAAGGLALLLALGAARSWTRTPVWASSDRVFAAMVDEHPRLWWVEYRAGVILANHGRPLEAVPWLESAERKTRYNDVGVGMDYVRVMRTVGRYDETEPVLRRLIRIYPNSVPAYVELATLRIGQGRYAEAVALLGQAERIPRWGPLSMVEIRNQRAMALDGLGRVDAALADRRETLRDPAVRGAVPPWYHYARLLQERGDTSAARQALDSARVRIVPQLRGALTLDPLPSLQSALIRGWGPLAPQTPASTVGP